MPTETMTPREGWLAVLRRETPDLIDAGIDVLNPVQWRCPNA